MFLTTTGGRSVISLYLRSSRNSRGKRSALQTPLVSFWVGLLLLMVASYITHFPMASKSHPYTVITPDTPLENLEDFFNQKGTDFALGECIGGRHGIFIDMTVTDAERRWVLAVATRADLEVSAEEMSVLMPRPL